jgi:hypothetical protein
MTVSDLLLDENLDLAIKGGDVVLGESTLQHQVLLLLSNKGEWRESPVVGVGLNNHLLNELPDDELRQVIRKEFERDGLQVGTIDLIDGLPRIEASYE